MPHLACQTCGRQIYTVAPIESLFAEERRCPRCGAFLSTERREAQRRTMERRETARGDHPARKKERRVAQQRTVRRRGRATT